MKWDMGQKLNSLVYLLANVASNFVYIFRPRHSTKYVDVAYCYRPRSMVCQSVTLVSPAKPAEPVEMPFGLRTPLVVPGLSLIHI